MKRQRPGGRHGALGVLRAGLMALRRGVTVQAEPIRPELDTTELMQRAGQQQLPEWLDRRDTAPFPGEVILPTLYGLGIVPTETPQMYRGSVFAGSPWGEPEE